MKYFRYFPSLKYDLDDNKSTREVVDLFRLSKVVNSITDDISFYRTYTIQDGERPDHVSMNIYGTQEYYWTFFLVNEGLKNVYENWPRTVQQLEDYVSEKYPYEYLSHEEYDLFNKFEVGENIRGLISGATATIVDLNTNLGWIRIKDRSGTFIQNELIRGDSTLDEVSYEGGGLFYYAAHHYELDGEVVPRSTPLAAMVSNYDHEVSVNEAKRDIRVIRPEFVGDVKRQFRDSINE
jgi:hypothetical protein